MKKKHLPNQNNNLLVFDIETVPFRDEEYSETQREYIKRKLDLSMSRNNAVNILDETSKIKGTDPYLSKIICIGLYYPQTNQRTALTNDLEHNILEAFWNAIRTERGLFISYNGVRFDVPYIIKRSMKYRIKPTNTEFLNHTKYNPNPPHFDVMQQLCQRDWNYSLKQACDFFGVPSPKDGAVISSSVAEAYYAGRIKEIADYCLRDLESTYTLYEVIRSYITNTR